jgi:hypothetical protein
MKKILSVLSLALVALAFVSCSKNSPEGVIEEYVSCVKSGQYEDVIDLCYFKKDLTDEEKGQYAAFLRDKMGPELEKKGGISGVEVTNVEMADDGESAKVAYTIKYGDGSEKSSTDEVVNVDGKWKLHTGK